MGAVKKIKGLGENGRNLRQMLEERDRLHRETGFYYGIEELSVMKEDPLKVELFSSRLISALIAARETTRQIVANPFVREVAELCTAFYTPEGDCVCQSTGIIIHIPLMGEVIKWMINHNYEEEVEINDGDTFTSNDNHIAGMHPLDVYDIMPVFYEGELVGWVATCIMTMEIGAIAPGTQPCASTEGFTDGFRISAEKTGVNDHLRKDFELGCYHKVRLPEMFILDRKGALGANIKAREEIKKTIKEFGLDYFRQVCREIIEMERRSHLEKIRMRTIPGRLRTYHPQEVPQSRLPVVIPSHRRDFYTLVPIEINIEASGRVVLDFDGAGPWGWHPCNATPSSLRGAVSLTLTQSTAYTGTANSGTMMAVDLKLPYDTIVWPTTNYISTVGLFNLSLNLGAYWLSLISRAYFARGFREEIMLGCGAATAWTVGGQDHMGKEPFGFMVADIGGTTGSGAFAYRDGLDNSFSIWQPEPDSGNIEVWELVLPLIWMGRRLEPSSIGHGKYRTGASVTTSCLVYKTPSLFIQGGGGILALEKLLPNVGIFGGYTAPTMRTHYVANANTKELIKEKRAMVHGLGDPRSPDITKLLEGTYRYYACGGIFISEDMLKDGDFIQVCNFGYAGAYGDPIERDTALIKEDLDNGLCLHETCRDVYCAEAVYDEKRKQWEIDEEKTKELRAQKRKERLKKAIPVKEWWVKRRSELMNGNIPPQLKGMYNGSLEKGEKWSREFRAFWNLPQDFTF